LAIYYNNSNIVKLLIEKGADMTIETDGGITPKQLASICGNMDIIQAIQRGEYRFNV
jgi:ankyrin repeat protein